MATATQPTKADAAHGERTRKKPRLSLSSSTTTTTITSANAPPTSISSVASSRPKSGLLPPTVNTSRLHYAFGSRLPLAGKENAPNNTSTLPATAPSTKHTKHSEPVKKPETDPATKSARRPKRRQSLLPPTAPSPTAAATATTAAVNATPSAKAQPHLATPSTPAMREADATAFADETTPAATKTEPVELSPIKPLRFETTSATDSEFWKCRLAFARSAMLQLKALEDRLSALAESPSLPRL